MNADKQKALESAGWKFGSADEFLGERPMSDSDKMRAEFEKWAKRNGCDIVQAKKKYGYWLFHTHLAWLSWQAAYAAGQKAEQSEVERLQAELAAAKAASVVPVELVSLGDADWECSVGDKCKTSEDADILYNWLRDKQQDTTPPTT